jgi:hypothetical protein
VSTATDDLGLWLEKAFFLPGDALLYVLITYAPPVAQLFAISSSDYGGVLSGFVSVIAWLVVLIVAGITYFAARDLDRALTQGIRRFCAELKRRLRVAAALLRSRRNRTRAPRDEPAIDFSMEFEFSDVEWRALRLHGDLQPGYALALSEVAAALELSHDEARRVLSKLKTLRLLDSTVGGLEGESAYTLTKTGRVYLVFRQMA